MISLCLHVAEASVKNNVIISRVIATATTIDTLVLIFMGNVNAILCVRYDIRGVIYWLMMNDGKKLEIMIRTKDEVGLACIRG